MPHLFLVVALLLESVCGLHWTPQGNGMVAGVVMDIHESVIPGATIRIEGPELRTVRTNERGRFEVALPEGIYQIRAEAYGFFWFRRAKFRVVPNKTINLNMTLDVLPSHPTEPQRPKYFRLRSSQILDKFPEILFRYYSHSSANNLMDFFAGRNSFRYAAEASCGPLMVYADRISFHKDSLLLEASGAVIADDGQKRTYASKARIDLKGEEFSVVLPNGPMDRDSVLREVNPYYDQIIRPRKTTH